VIASALDRSSYYTLSLPAMAQAVAHVEALRGRIPEALFIEVHRELAQARLDQLAPILCGLVSTFIVWIQQRAAVPLVGRRHAATV